jgi:hypothetical protein
LEEAPQNEIKAYVKSIEQNSILLAIDPHVIATIKIKMKNHK